MWYCFMHAVMILSLCTHVVTIESYLIDEHLSIFSLQATVGKASRERNAQTQIVHCTETKGHLLHV